MNSFQWWLDFQFESAREKIDAAIEAKAEKQRRWLRAAIITRNRSIGQRFRYITGRGK